MWIAILNKFPHPCAIDAWSGAWIGAIIDGVSDIGVEELTDVNVNGVAVAVTALESAMTASSDVPMAFR